MSAISSIEWTDATWNPTRGCSKVSAGCRLCYAERFAERWRGIPGHPFEQGFDLRLVPEALDLPRRWKKPKRIFVNSMSDLFHEGVPFGYIGRVWEAMGAAPWHTFQILTKRPKRMLEFFERGPEELKRAGLDEWWKGYSILPNVHLGVSVEDQRAANRKSYWANHEFRKAKLNRYRKAWRERNRAHRNAADRDYRRRKRLGIALRSAPDVVAVAKRLLAKATQAAKMGYTGKLTPGGI